MKQLAVIAAVIWVSGCPGGGGYDEEATYLVKVVSAEITQTNNGTSWDTDDSAPDAKATLNCGATSGTTSVVESYSPTWSDGSCTAKGKDLTANGVTVQFLDEDLTVDDPVTGVTSLELTSTTISDGNADWDATGGVTKFRLSFTQQ